MTTQKFVEGYKIKVYNGLKILIFRFVNFYNTIIIGIDITIK